MPTLDASNFNHQAEVRANDDQEAIDALTAEDAAVDDTPTEDDSGVVESDEEPAASDGVPADEVEGEETEGAMGSGMESGTDDGNEDNSSEPIPSESLSEENERLWHERERQLLDDCAECSLELLEAEERLEQAKTDVKECTQEVAKAARNLRAHRHRSPDEVPLLARSGIEDESGSVVGEGSGTKSNELDRASDQPQAPPEGQDESWRLVTTVELGLSKALCNLLEQNEEMPIRTLGDITDWTDRMKDYAGDPLTHCTKIGKAKAEKINQAVTDYFEQLRTKQEDKLVERLDRKGTGKEPDGAADLSDDDVDDDLDGI